MKPVYIMSLDGGGTKLSCLIADRNGEICGQGSGGAANSTFNRPEQIAASISNAIESALAGSGLHGSSITDVYCAMPAAPEIYCKAIMDSLHNSVRIRPVSEFAMSLYAAIQQEQGALTLSGTGSFAAAQTGKSLYHVGGYGSLFSDEGSGYDIGRLALNRCLHMSDGIGPYTMLYEKVAEQLERHGKSHIVDIYSFPAGEQRTFIASICRLVGACAREGDPVSMEILQEAAERLAFQTNGLLAKCGDEMFPGFPVTVSGGVWKAHPILFSTFARLVKQQHPQVKMMTPLFEPVVGGILLGLRDRSVDRSISLLKQEYREYVFPPIV
ncbi:N-acetylglucosamine kinase [Paenibacillus thermotolerans]|uniref:N-acetylglucosamine kinase n=1 Tax=Paenibacillus thermotolerans TaxID=3027807 RepID=UPI00236796FC|nr:MULTISPECIES: BadF/BadG/BcrA/BcrD ATPase family protein [unclassified Paenibacillus]